ncbi:unnamed protein product [Camellia sinensis]
MGDQKMERKQGFFSALKDEVGRGLSPGRSRGRSPSRSVSPGSGLLRRRRPAAGHHVAGPDVFISRSESLRPAEALSPLMEGPDPDELDGGDSRMERWGHWMKGQLGLCLSTVRSELAEDKSFKMLLSNAVVNAYAMGSWNWRGYSIRYQYSGNNGPVLVLVHGFGANSDHWRKNIPVLACSHRVFSIDLIGYGYSDKPNPSDFEANSFYTFETWAAQLNDFCIDVVKDKAFFICNSIGAVREPEVCTGIILLNLSLRMLHIKKQPWYGRPLIRSFQSLLSILCQCYHDTSQVTDELVEAILLPGLEPGAADVFLEFICYSGGPLPEELLPQVKCPVLIAWGDKDPWEPIELGRAYDKFDSVEDFIVLPNVGHCPQDEAPHLVNPIVESFVARHATPQVSLSTKATTWDCNCLLHEECCL